MKIGIIGLGNFGRFAAEMLARDPGLEVVAFDANGSAAPEGVQGVGLADVAAADAVVLCVPLAAYAGLLAQLRPLINPETLVVDICSVKVEAEKRLRTGLPDHQNLLVTHPMFGPKSATNGTAGHVLVVTGSYGKKADATVDYCRDTLGLKIVRMTNEEHDKMMADLHALTYFVARGLSRYGVQEDIAHVPSFQTIRDLITFDRSHTEELFQTIELGNPFAKSAREKFIKTLQEINDRLDKEKI